MNTFFVYHSVESLPSCNIKHAYNVHTRAYIRIKSIFLEYVPRPYLTPFFNGIKKRCFMKDIERRDSEKKEP